MLFDGIKLVEGSEIQNLVIDAGATFPLSPDTGELFYRNDAGNEGMYMFDGTAWVRFISDQDNATSILPADTVPGTYRSVTVSEKGLVTAGTNPTTLSGYGITDAQPLDDDLTAISALGGSTGLLKKTGINSWTLDPSAYLTGNQNITVTGDASGSGSTAIALTLASTGVAAGAYGSSSNVPTISVDSKGRITSVSNNPITVDATSISSGTFAPARISQSSVTQHQAALTISESQITDGSILARVGGNESITGSWTFNSAVTGQSPTIGSHLATKAYVDNVAQGLTAKASVDAATTGNVPLTGLSPIDGVTITEGSRVLVKNQTNATENGVYVADLSAWVRAEDMDGTPTNDVAPGNTVFVEQGTSNGSTTWVIINTTPISLGTTPITWSLLSRIGGLSVSGGLTLTGNDIAVSSVSPSRIVVNANNIDLATTGVTAGTYVSTTVDAYGRVTGGSATQSWGTITGKPTTLAGYGITDAALNDPLLASISLLPTNGILTKTGTSTTAARSIAVSGTGLSVTNADGVAGNPTVTSNATATNTASTIVARDAAGNSYFNYLSQASANNENPSTIGQVMVTNGTDGMLRKSSMAHLTSQLSGTAPINISGSAGSANNATTVNGATLQSIARATDHLERDFSSAVLAGRSDFTSIDALSNTPFGAHWYYMANIRHRGGNGDGTSWGWQLAAGMTSNSNRAAFRTQSLGTWSSWYELLTSASYNSFVPSLTGTGASGTWGIGITGNAATATTWATARTLSATGDVTGTSAAFNGSANAGITLTLANSGVTAGTYRSVTVDAKGRVTTGTNPTTLAGYGITDAQPLDADLTSIAGLAGTTGFLKKTAANTWALDTTTYLTGNQTVTVSGDATGSGTTSISLTLANSGVTAGTYTSVTVDAKGRVTTGTNPTTLSGYGITDAQPLDADLTSIAGLVGTTGFLKKTAADTWALDTATYLTGNETVTVSGDATGSGTTSITLTLANSGVTAGTYKSVTVDAKGRVTTGTNPTTLAGYGITDAQPLDAELTALAGLATNGLMAKTGAGTAATRSIAVSGTGLSVTNADGVAGNPTVTSNATSANTASTIVARDASGNFSAGTITASLSGNATTATTATNNVLKAGDTMTGSLTISATNAALLINGGASGNSSNLYFQGAGGTRWRLGKDTTAESAGNAGSNFFLNAYADDGSTLVGTALSLSRSTLAAGFGGTVTSASGFIGPLTGNASTATTWATARTISATGDVTGTSAAFNGSANAGITLTLANSGVTAGTYGSAATVPTITVDAKGRITTASNTPVQIAESQITDGPIFARLADSETISGNWQFNSAVVVGQPSQGSHAATKDYVDNVASGLNVHLAVRAATASALSATYSNGVSGVGATLTGVGTLSAIDGVSLAVNDRVLVKNQATPAQNGIYTVTATTPNWVMTRATDFDGAPTNEIVAGDSTFVQEGGQGSTQWVQTTVGSISVGTTAIAFTQFGGPGSYTAGGGMTLAGTTFSVGTAAASRIVVNVDNIDLATTGVTAGTYKSVSVDSYGRVTTGTNPTTLSGYGITDAQPLDADLTSIAGLAGTAGFLKKTAANTWALDTAAYITGNQTVTVSGDATGSGTTSISLTLANSGVTAGTYKSVTVDAKGRVTTGTNPTTLSGYGITDAQPLDADLTSIAGLVGTTGFLKKTAADTWALDTTTYLTGNQTVTVSGDATGSGTTSISLTLANSGVTAGTYKSVTVDAKGRVTTGTNPTTLSGYGITDAQPLDAELTALAGLATNGLMVKTGAGTAATRSIAVSGTGLSVTNADGVAGNPTVTSNATATNTASTIVARDASGNFAAGTITASLSGNATTATTLQTGRLINGVSFNGSSDITVAANAATLTGSSLASGVTGSSLTSVGTLSSLAVTGNVSVSSGYTQRSIATGITAAGTTQGTATVLNREINVVSSVSAGSGVLLPSSIGTTFIVVNAGANTLNVYPVSSGAIDSQAANASFSLPVGSKIMFIQVSATQYYTLNATYA